MKIIVGLGNVGLQYEKTRHNAGFLVVDELAQRHASAATPQGKFNAVTLDAFIGGEKCLLLKPTTLMNLSGRSVGEAVRFFKLEPADDLLVLVDELALPVGAIRVGARGGDGGHNGLKDITRALGGAPYMRIRVGIGAKPPMMNQADWVLSRFTAEEAEPLKASVLKAADAAEAVVADGVDAAMNRFNEKVGGGKKARRKAAAPDADADSAENTRSGGDSGPRSANDDVHPGWTGPGG